MKMGQMICIKHHIVEHIYYGNHLQLDKHEARVQKRRAFLFLIMLNPSPTTAEHEYARLFPNQAIPDWALGKMKLLEYHKYSLKEDGSKTVPLSRIVGTTHGSYGDKVRWLNMLTAKKKSNFRPQNWPGFLSADTSSLDLIRIDGTEDYYINGEGNHRISALKLAGRESISCNVQIAYPAA